MTDNIQLDTRFDELIDELSQIDASPEDVILFSGFLFCDISTRDENDYEELSSEIKSSLSKLTEISDSGLITNSKKVGMY